MITRSKINSFKFLTDFRSILLQTKRPALTNLSKFSKIQIVFDVDLPKIENMHPKDRDSESKGAENKRKNKMDRIPTKNSKTPTLNTAKKSKNSKTSSSNIKKKLIQSHTAEN